MPSAVFSHVILKAGLWVGGWVITSVYRWDPSPKGVQRFAQNQIVSHDLPDLAALAFNHHAVTFVDTNPSAHQQGYGMIKE